MKTTHRFLLSISMAAFLWGCTATYQLPEPTELENVLLAGQFEIMFTDNPNFFGGFGGALPEGSYTEHIRMTFANGEMGERYETTTLDESGLFLLRVPSHSELHLIHLAIHLPGNNRPGYTFSMLDPESPEGDPLPIRTFQVGAQQVYDLGHIRHTGGAPIHLNTEQAHQEGETQALFREKFPESQWNQFTWEQKEIGEFPAFQLPPELDADI